MLGHSNHVIFGIGLLAEKYDTLFDSQRHKYCSAGCSVYFKDWAGVAKVIKSVIFQDISIWKAVSQKLKVGGGKSVHFLKVCLRPIRKLMFGELFCLGHRNTDLHRI